MFSSLTYKAYEKNLMYPRSTFLHPAWWVGEWWKDPPNSTENLTCSEEQRAQVVDRSIAVLLHEYIEDDADVAETGTVSCFVFAVFVYCVWVCVLYVCVL